VHRAPSFPLHAAARSLVLWSPIAFAAAIAACSAGKDEVTTHPGADGSVSDGPGFDLGVEDAADSAKPPPAPTTVIVTGAPADAPTKFGGAAGDAAHTPSIVYPADGVMVPPNMGTLEFHFMPGTGNTLFEITFVSGDVNLEVYTPCTAVGGGCVFSPDDATWKKLTGATAGGDVIRWSIRGTDGAGGQVGTSKAQRLSFAEEKLTGGLYYWNAGAGATMRYEFGVSGKKGETFLNAATAGVPTCVGCHELSTKGDKIAEGYSIPAPSGFNVYDVALKTALFKKTGTGNFFAWSPDGDRLLASTGSTMVLLDGNTGAQIVGVANQASMMTWSPDGATIVYAKEAAASPIPAGKPGVSQGSLETLHWNGSVVSKGTTLVPYAGQNNYYPAFAPDSNLVAFNRSPSNHDSYDAPDALVYVVKTTGGTPIQLANASPPGGRGDSWPKWTPTVQHDRGHPLFWITFSSRRQYGLRLNTATPTTDNPGTAQIWMAAIDPTKAAANQDPSYPAFWLPFPNMGSGNHIAQWVLTVSRKPCKTYTDCAGDETCANDLCVPAIQ
jgi:hypothetical protein